MTAKFDFCLHNVAYTLLTFRKWIQLGATANEAQSLHTYLPTVNQLLDPLKFYAECMLDKDYFHKFAVVNMYRAEM